MSKTDSFLKFRAALNYKNQSDALKSLCNARSGLLGLRKISSLSVEKENLEKYACASIT